MGELLQVIVHKQRCIGCRACSSSCPAGLITLTDDRDRRRLRLSATCSEACTRCRDVCQEAAITLESASKDRGDSQILEFPLVCCPECHTPFITDRMMEKLRAAMTEQIQPIDPSWISICPSCRRACEARHIVGLRKGVAWDLSL